MEGVVLDLRLNVAFVDDGSRKGRFTARRVFS